MALRYWVGGSGDWTDTTKWSATSGGTGGETVPNSADDVIVDGNSGSPTINMGSSNRSCKSITTTGSTCLFTTGSVFTFIDINISGDITLSSTTTFQRIDNLEVLASSTITSNGVSLPNLELDSTGATFNIIGTISAASISVLRLDSVVTFGGNISTGGFDFRAGTVNIGNNDVSLRAFQSNTTAPCTLNMGSGTWTFTGSSNVFWDLGSDASNVTINAETANIVFNSSDSSIQFTGGGKTYNKITLAGSTVGQLFTFSGSNTFTEFESTKPVAFTLAFQEGTTNSLGIFKVTGTSGNVVAVRSTSSSVQATLVKKETIWAVGANSTVNDCTNVFAASGIGINFMDFDDIIGEVVDPISANTFLQLF